jgi:uncharacterized membrane protein
VASRGRVSLKPVSGSEELREALRILGSVPSDQLLALEVIWQPEGAGEVLSTDELITAYPDLKHSLSRRISAGRSLPISLKI